MRAALERQREKAGTVQTLKFSKSFAHRSLEIARIEARENAGLNGIPKLGVFKGKQIMQVDLPTESNLTEAAHVTSDSHHRHEFDILSGFARVAAEKDSRVPLSIG